MAMRMSSGFLMASLPRRMWQVPGIKCKHFAITSRYLQSSSSSSNDNDDNGVSNKKDPQKNQIDTGPLYPSPMTTTRMEIFETMEWVQRVVIGLNLCPFARKPLREKRLHVKLLDDPQQILALVKTEMELLMDANAGTTLVVCPTLYPQDFLAFWEVVQTIEEDVIAANDWQGIVQIAPFHPLFVFEGSSSEDNDDGDDEESYFHPDNYTNRSPYPMIHILREADVTAAVDTLPNGNAALIWTRNVELLHAIATMLPKNLFQDVMRGKRCDESVRNQLRQVLRDHPSWSAVE